MSVTMSLFIFLIISLFIFVVLYFYTAIKGRNLYTYLNKNKLERWQELTTIGDWGPGMFNFFELISYSYSTIDNDDKNILKLKHSLRNGLKYSLLFLIVIIIICCLLIISIKKGL